MIEIPLVQGDNQNVTIVLNNQICSITVFNNTMGTFLTLAIGSNLIRAGMICLDRVPMITETYLGFYGQLMFVDTQGTDDPIPSGFGDRFKLYYLEPGIDI